MLGRKMSFTRLQKLAMKYGFFARFFPEGTEGDEVDADGNAVDGAIADSEQADLKDNKEFDKVRQQSDQHKANAERANEKTNEVTEQLEAANSRTAELEQQLEEAKSAASDAGVDIDKMDLKDFTETDVDIVRAIKSLNAEMKTVKSENKGLKETANKFKTDQATKAATSEKDKAYQSLLSDLDKDYGAENRNVAVKAFEAKVTAGEVKGGPAKATRILEGCYKAAAADSTKTGKKASVRLDSVTGGGEEINYSGLELTEGTLDEVTDQAGKILNKGS